MLRFLGRLHDEAIHVHQQEASEKRQGTKSRAVGHPTVQEDRVTLDEVVKINIRG
jgi:hypothetical protein